jgi:hypothetical protein
VSRFAITRSVAALVATVSAALCVAAPASAQTARPLNPVIFVHGYVGSGGQFESQKMRFVENGYPDSYVTVIEYNSAPATPVPGATGLNPVGVQVIEQQLFPRLDQLIAQLKQQTGRPKVELVAHSLGTTLMQDYLNSDPGRAASVADYVNVDGRTATSLPGGVRTLALWATRGPLSPPGRSITGATNVTIPDTTHVQCATSPVSFRAMYEFFTGAIAKTTDILPERGPITLSGKVLDFPDNDGLAGSTLQVWPVDSATGQRTSTDPVATYQIDSSGDFGPVSAQPGRRYEFALMRPGVPVHHFYYEPFLRSDHLIRLLESDALRTAGGAPDANSVAMVLLRYKELWGDQGGESDVLKLNGLSVCNAMTCPLNNLVNALFAADFNHDGKSDTSKPNSTYYQLPFVSGVDVFMPAQNPAVGKVTVSLRARGEGPVRTLTFPNFPGTTDVVTVQLNDFEQALATKPAPAVCVRRRRLVIRIRQPRHGRIVRVNAYINGRLVKRAHGYRVRSVTLRRPRRADFRVVLVEYTADGRRIQLSRHFHRCGR